MVEDVSFRAVGVLPAVNRKAAMPNSYCLIPPTGSSPHPGTGDILRPVGRAVVLLLAWILIALPTAVSAGVRDDHPNLVGGEVLGRGFALTPLHAKAPGLVH